VKLEREPDPATVPSGGETSGGEPSGDGLPVDPSDTDRPTAGPAVGTAPSLVIPAEISPAWWLEHRHCFEWSERQRALVLRPGEEVPIGPAVIFEDPPGAPPVPSTPSASPSDPDLLDGFIGQEAAVANLKRLVYGAKLRGTVPPPALLAGPPGLGKTTLANLAARELGTRTRVAAGPALADTFTLFKLLVSLGKGDVLFIDEIHGLPTSLGECFYQALDQGTVSMTIVCGSEAHLVKLRLEPFFFIGATTEEAKIAKPLLSRFVLRERLDLYSTAELAAIAMVRARGLGVEIAPEAAEALASASRGTPRELVGLLLMARDEAQVSLGRPDGAVITPEIAESTLRSRGIDRFGLWEIERKILCVLHAKGGAVGLHTLADMLGESWLAIRDVHEPFLLRDGWLVRTRKGRILTDRARRVVTFGLESGRRRPDQA